MATSSRQPISGTFDFRLHIATYPDTWNKFQRGRHVGWMVVKTQDVRKLIEQGFSFNEKNILVDSSFISDAKAKNVPDNIGSALSADDPQAPCKQRVWRMQGGQSGRPSFWTAEIMIYGPEEAKLAQYDLSKLLKSLCVMEVRGYRQNGSKEEKIYSFFPSWSWLRAKYGNYCLIQIDGEKRFTPWWSWEIAGVHYEGEMAPRAPDVVLLD
ncbi:hypothetical protein QBC40DRAFT_251190 [Triangularia verruculosa]|uniref:Uncharacterized protein n=1 Tax=Triangularia verruculosa TaxID=2587418 RepID=A0AAN6XPS3_9PEZI|nr:hypothetical protein QBC40DRAFT_251190 [Triangularia verruculosa]